MDYKIRPIRKAEIPQLKDFLYEAIFIPEGVAAPPREIVNDESLQVYIRNFGQEPDDRCLVAEADNKIVGAIWSRIMNDYGHIADNTPSIAISLHSCSRCSFSLRPMGTRASPYRSKRPTTQCKCTRKPASKSSPMMPTRQ